MNACADTLLNTLQVPEVRDLAWACFSPPLILSEAIAPTGMRIANCGLSLDAERRNWLEKLDREPRSLMTHLDSLRSNRLGLYFETLWHFFLQQDERIELLAHNLPVRDGSKTIGEFDCLYYCHDRQRHFHLELAVKFYLGLPTGDASNTHSQWNHWLGPGANDRLDLKMQRMLQHQMQLGQHPKARKSLQDLGIEHLELEMEIKGRLFKPAGHALPPPLGYNSELPMAHWTTTLDPREGTENVVLEKRHWLAPLVPASAPPASSAPHFGNRPYMVAALDQNGCEMERFFVVPEQWPENS